MKVFCYLRMFFGSIVFNIVFPMLSVIAYCILAPFIFIFYGKACGDIVQVIWAKFALWLVRFCCGITYEIKGEQNLPKTKKGFIVASKHQSMWETIVFLNYFKKPSYILKRQLLWIPFYGWAVATTSNIAVNRSGGSSALRDMTSKVKKALKVGRRIIIFPQGTRTPIDAGVTKYPYKAGIIALYSQTDATVVPAVLNSGMFWGKRQFFKKSGKITVEFLPPIKQGLNKKEFKKTLQDAIEKGTNKLVESANTK